MNVQLNYDTCIGIPDTYKSMIEVVPLDVTIRSTMMKRRSWPIRGGFLMHKHLSSNMIRQYEIHMNSFMVSKVPNMKSKKMG